MCLTTNDRGHNAMNSQENLEPSYLSYMLRLWRKRDGNGNPVWCASLEEPGSQHTESFADADSMFSFLQDRLGMDDQGKHQVEQPQQQDLQTWQEQHR